MSGMFKSEITSDKNTIKLIRLWIEALRSGKYKQGRSTLRKENLFCCLGVVCDVINPNEWKRVEGSHEMEWKDGSGATYLLVLKDRTIDMLGLSDEIGSFTNDSGRKMSLTEVNDILLSPFSEIASLIEKELNLVLGVNSS